MAERDVPPGGRGNQRLGNQWLGRYGEQQAVRYLESTGYRVLERNWRCRHGEIDVVAELRGQLVFVEVKTRTSDAFGHPFEAITAAKLRRMHVLARLWCAAHPGATGSVRLDVIGVLAPGGSLPRIEHLEGVHA
ncbi:YraN family protein [Microterricola pindariensis]|uniref:UPF0102 protein GY24_12585 n=1 Tax=Microterricola pindariensis TaxID=478010 RepID=A0ABX5AUF9_9MICO|nr:YraN family protein [Microterricola pindariensis]PPL16511.1 hypothetical protein GY24_12585 [Microterricola pindariensis]